jgi:hypothetical protein
VTKTYIAGIAIAAAALAGAYFLLSDNLRVDGALGASVGTTGVPWPGEMIPTEPEPAPQATTAALDPENAYYIEVLESCGPYYSGEQACVNVRSGPSVEASVVTKLRKGVVLKAANLVHGADRDWYEIAFDETLRFPERLADKWYIAADLVQLTPTQGVLDLLPGTEPQTTKHILVDRSDQMLYAYDGEELFMEQPISTGLDETPTPRGTFTVFRKTPSRYMQGPIEGISDQYYDLPGVPWNLYFTAEGAVIHGAYWHDHFGQPWSHGCVNLPPELAKKLYLWADLGTPVTIQD